MLSATPTITPSRILFAMPGNVLETFLPGFSPQIFAPHECRHVATEDMNTMAWQALLTDYRPAILVSGWGTPPIPAAFIDSPEFSLRYLCHTAGTVRHIAPRHLLDKGVAISNWGNTISHTIAEHAVLLTLAALRCMPEWREILVLQEPQYTAAIRSIPTRRLRGKRVGLHGFGAIARELVPMFKAFHANVLTHSDGVPLELLSQYDIQICSTMEELFSQSDVLIECKALTEQTRGLISERILSLLPQNAVFVNIGRGQVVDESALIKLASAKRIRVALDVFAQEPLPPASKLFSAEGMILSPHVAGPTLDALPDCGQLALNNIRSFLSGETIQAIVTHAVYDRST